MLGDGRSVTLAGLDGSVDWWPVPTVHPPPICAAILDPSRGGRFSLAPVERTRPSAHLWPTPTCCKPTTGRSPVSCGSPRRSTRECQAGCRGRSWPAGSTGSRGGWRCGGVSPQGIVSATLDHGPLGRRGGGIVVPDQNLALLVHGAKPGTVSAHEVSGEALVSEGERLLVTVVVTDHEPLSLPTRQSIERRLDHSCRSWHEWSDGIDYDGPWRGTSSVPPLPSRRSSTNLGAPGPPPPRPSPKRGGHETRAPGTRGCATARSPSTPSSVSACKRRCTPRCPGSSQHFATTGRNSSCNWTGACPTSSGSSQSVATEERPGAGRQPGSRPAAARELRRPVRHGRPLRRSWAPAGPGNG